MKLIKTTVLDASAASVTISNIPQEFKTLKLVVSARSSDSPTTVALKVTLNGNTSSYSYRHIYGNGSSAVSGNASSQANLRLTEIPAASVTASTFANAEIVIPNYYSSANKAIAHAGVSENNATEAYQWMTAGLWANSSAVTSIELSPNSGNFVAGSTFYLYGVA